MVSQGQFEEYDSGIEDGDPVGPNPFIDVVSTCRLDSMV